MSFFQTDYPAYGDLEGDVSNEDYLVQDVMEMMEKHPELWARLLQGSQMFYILEDEQLIAAPKLMFQGLFN